MSNPDQSGSAERPVDAGQRASSPSPPVETGAPYCPCCFQEKQLFISLLESEYGWYCPSCEGSIEQIGVDKFQAKMGFTTPSVEKPRPEFRKGRG